MPDPNDKRTDKHPGAPRGLAIGQDWPACRYSPDGEAQIFQKAEDVPEGWEDSPAKFKPVAVAERGERKASFERQVMALEEREAEVARQQILLSNEVRALEEREVAVEQREALCDQRETALDEHEASLTAPPAPPEVPEKPAKGRGKKVVIEADDVDDRADDADED